MNITMRVVNYIQRYAPSRKKILAYIEKKKYINPEGILNEVSYNEGLMIGMWMRSFLATGKSEGDISLKLRRKGFPREMIITMLETYREELYNWDDYKNTVMQQIQALSQKGKSQKIITLMMIQKYPYFREQILEGLTDFDDGDSLKKEVQKYKNTYNLSDPKQKQKFYAALLRKGFSYSDIKRQITHLDEEDAFL